MRILNKFKTLYIIAKYYGCRSALKAIVNKLRHKNLLSGLKIKNGRMFANPGIFFPSEHYNKIGYELFKKQQNDVKKIGKDKFDRILNSDVNFSIIIPIYNPESSSLKKAINSILKQLYKNWELVLVDDGSTKREHIEIIKNYLKRNKQIKYHINEKNNGISFATNIGIKNAKYENILLMDQDDELSCDALFWFANELIVHPNAEFIYSDECKIDENDKLCDFYLKPDWSKFLLLSHMYTSHLTMYKKSLLKKAGFFRSKYDFSQDYDLALRISLLTKNIFHIERILYFWRMTKTSGAANGKKFSRKISIAALQDYFDVQNIKGVVKPENYINAFYPKITTEPKISIIIPSDSIPNILKCINMILKKTNYSNYDIVIVTRSDIGAIILSKCKDKKIKICEYNKKFNFSDKCNIGAIYSKSKFIVFYNDDVYPYKNDWLLRLLDVATLPNVASVSPCCLYPNGLIQYAGMYTNTVGIISTAFISTNFMRSEGPFNHHLMRNVSIMSGACSIVNRAMFLKVGGFDSINTPNGGSDVLLSFKFIKDGYDCVYNPSSLVIHIGKYSWRPHPNEIDKNEIYLLKHYSQYLQHDPFFTYSQKILYSTNFRDSTYRIVSKTKPKNCDSKIDCLIVIPELNKTYLTQKVHNLITSLLAKNKFVLVVTYKNDSQSQYLDNNNIPYIIYEDAEKDSFCMLYRFIKNFDEVYIKSCRGKTTVKLLKNEKKPIYWILNKNEAKKINKNGNFKIIID